MDVTQAIKYANSILPGVPAPEGQDDPRWKAIIDLGEFVQSNPEEVWSFVSRWGVHPDEDLRAAIATCLLEHLLEHHFDLLFPRVEYLATKSTTFGQTFSMCTKFGNAVAEDNSRAFDRLKERILRREQGGRG